MAELKNITGKKMLTSQSNINYSFILQTSRPMGLLVEEGTTRTLYHFDPQRGTPVVTDEILKSAFMALLKTDCFQLDLFLIYCQRMDQYEKYCQIAEEAFREHFNTLYNSEIAWKIFKREKSLSNIRKRHNFFEDFHIDD